MTLFSMAFLVDQQILLSNVCARNHYIKSGLARKIVKMDHDPAFSNDFSNARHAMVSD
jgi:hypothetical protein